MRNSTPAVLLACCLTAASTLAPAATPASAKEQDLSSESADALSSFGSSVVGVGVDALSSAGDSSSQRPAPATAKEPGKLGGTQKVGTTNAARITYTSTKENGEVVSVTGALFEAAKKPGRKAPKGLIALAPGTRGMGDQCAPSAPDGMVSSLSGSSVNVNYESPVVRALTEAGYRVVVTDYIGLGSEGVHTYMNRVEQGHALIDAARATAKPGEKIGFWGYSQGGGAAAAAAELVAEYAPELNVVGTFSGAPPADPLAVLETASAGLVDVVAGFGAASFAATYPEFREALDEALTDEGKKVLNDLSKSCVIEGPRVARKPFAEYIKGGRSFADLAKADPRLGEVLEHNKLGKVPVSAPILVVTSPDDDLVPEPQVTQLAEDYCALGAPVEYRRVLVPGTASAPMFTLTTGASSLVVSGTPGGGHAAPLVLQTNNAIAWMDARFAGEAFAPVCPADAKDVVIKPGLNSVEVTFTVLGVLAGLLGLVALGGGAAYMFGLLPPEVAGLIEQARAQFGI